MSNVIATTLAVGTQLSLTSPSLGIAVDVSVEAAGGGGGGGAGPHAGTDLYIDATLDPNEITSSDPSTEYFATDIAGAPVFPAGSTFNVAFFCAVAAATPDPGNVLAGMQIEYSLDSGGTFNPVNGTAQAAFVAVDDTVPTLGVSGATVAIDASGAASIMFRAVRFNGITAAVAALFTFCRSQWVYNAPPEP